MNRPPPRTTRTYPLFPDSTLVRSSFNTDFKRTFVVVSFGGVLVTEAAWLGVAANHLNKPNQSIIGERSLLPVKLSFHGGFKFYMKPGVMGSGEIGRAHV